MSTWTFVHAADLHLDSPLLGLARREDAPTERLRGATRRALENLVDLCLEVDARLLLIAGDVFDRDWKDYQTGLFFLRQMGRLKDAGTRVYLIRGNHDAVGVISRRLTLPEHVYEFSSRTAETVRLEEPPVAIHGRSYAQRTTTEDLSQSYPAPVDGVLNLALLHTSADGRPGHQTYAPCRVEALANHGFDYWALGHVHTREVIREDPWIVFPGNPQGRHIREPGAKGAYVVTADEGGITDVEFRPLDVVRWAHLEVDVGDANTLDTAALVRESLGEAMVDADGRILAARVRVFGASGAHAEIAARPDVWESEVLAAAADVSPEDLWIEKLVTETRTPIDLDSLRTRDDPLGGLLRGIEAVRASPEETLRLREVLRDLTDKLPPETRAEKVGLDLEDPETLARILDDVEQILVPLLLKGDDS